MRRVLLMIAGILITSAHAHAATWQPYSSPKASGISYDVETIKLYKDGTVDVWEKAKWPLRAAEKRRQHSAQYRRYSHSLHLLRYDCNEGKYAPMEVYDYDMADNLIGQDISKKEVYDEQGHLIDSFTGPVYLYWFRIIPDSIGADKAQELCAIRQQATEPTKSRNRSNKYR